MSISTTIPDSSNYPPANIMETVEKSLPGDWVIIHVPDSKYLDVFTWCFENTKQGEYYVIGGPNPSGQRAFKIRFAKDAMLCLLTV